MNNSANPSAQTINTLTPEAHQRAMSVAMNPRIPQAAEAIKQASSRFQQEGQAAFRTPEMIEAMNLAFEPLIAQSVGQPLQDGMVIGAVQLVDMIPTDRDTLRLKLAVQPINPQTGEAGAPYESWLTEQRTPEAQGGVPMELSLDEVRQVVQSLGEVARLQQEAPDKMARASSSALHELMF